MKKLTLFFLTLLIIFSNSCITFYRVEKTNSQVLNSYKTKDQVLHNFGVPAHKRGEGTYSEWTYDFGSTNVSRSSANAYDNYYGGVSASGTTVNETYSRYLKFTFNGNNVTKWDCQGVDYTKRVVDKKKTRRRHIITASITGTICAIYLILNALLYK